MNHPAWDPYPEFARRRRLASAVVEEVETTSTGRRLQWFGVYRWDAVRAALGDDALSAGMYHEGMGLSGRYGEILIGMDGPGHRAHRAVLQASFSRASVNGRLRDAVARPIEHLVGALAPLGAADLWPELCQLMPALVLTRLFGVGDDLAELLRRQAAVLERGDVTRAASESDALHDALRPVIDERRHGPPGHDLISVLARGRIGDRPLSDLDVFSHLRLLSIAGTDTVSRATANLLFALLVHPEQLAVVRSDRSLIPPAIEEAVRWETPAVSVPRVAARDTRIGDVDIPRGSGVRCCLSSANHDDDRWVDPDRYDLRRAPLANAGFGLGAHACLGLHLAQLVMAHTLTTLLSTMPALRLDADVPPPAMAGEYLRAPTHLRVRWS